MTKAAINAIIFGTMLIALGMMPAVITGMMEGLENLRHHLSATHNRRADFHRSGDIWLVVCGGVMVIVGFVVLLAG